MTPIEYIFLGLLVGGFLLTVLTAFGFFIWKLTQVHKSLDLLVRAVGDSGTADFAGAVKLIAGSVPAMVRGVNGLAEVMGVFNKTILNRQTMSEAGAIGVAALETEDESSFTPYNEEEAAAREAAELYKQETGIDKEKAERMMDKALERSKEVDRAFFADPGKSSPPSFVPVAKDVVPFRPIQQPVAEVTIETPPATQPSDSK